MFSGHRPGYNVSVIDCTLVTCETVPALDPDDRLLMHELHKRGLTVTIEAWSDPFVDWSASRLCILRSTWDYHERHEEFIAWVGRVASLTVLRNEPHLLTWNSHKSYLRDLEQLGVPVVSTAWVAQGEGCSFAELCDLRGWGDVVLKPALGAASHGVTLVRRDAASRAAGQAQLEQAAQAHDVLVQPYLHSVVTYGERGLIFFDRRYSHAIGKKPFDTVLAVGDARASLIDATPEEIEVAANTLAAVPGQPLYARVDLLRDDEDRACVNELELIEPGLYLGADESAPAHFADAVERELENTKIANTEEEKRCVSSGSR
jgi:hypothetical protein